MYHFYAYDVEMREYMNTKDMCIVCFGPPEREYRLIVHHVTYFPEKCCYVHYSCHQKIHDPDDPITYLIQYGEGDSRRFYKAKAQKGNDNGGVRLGDIYAIRKYA